MTNETTATSTLEQGRAVAAEFFSAVHERDVHRMQTVWKPGSIEASATPDSSSKGEHRD